MRSDMTNRDPKTGRFTKKCATVKKTPSKACACKCKKTTTKKVAKAPTKKVSKTSAKKATKKTK